MPISAGASQPRGGPSRRPSMTSRRASSSRSCKPLVRILGQRLRLAKGRSEAERPAAVRHRDRRPRHPLHPRSLAASQRAAADHDARLAGLGVRAAQDRRSAHRSRPPMAERAKTPSISSCRRCLATASPASRRTPAGVPTASRAWAELMKRLGYTRYVAQGGDWGSPVSSAMARQAPPACSASTSTCRRSCRPRWPRRSLPADLHRRDYPRRNARRSTRSMHPPRRAADPTPR